MRTKTLSLVVATLLLSTHIYAEETLDDIIVTSTNKTAQSIQNTTSNVTVITSEDIEENGYQTVAEAISHISGISITHNGGMGQATSIFTRGMDGGQTLVLIDGMRANDPSTPNGAALLETFTTNNVSQIEVLKGGSSSIWGSNASAGVINIITKKAEKGVHGFSSMGYGKYDTKTNETQISYRDEKLLAQFDYAKIHTDGFSSKTPSNAEEDRHENKNYHLKLGYAFNKYNRIKLSYDNIKTDTEFDAGTAEDDSATGKSKQRNYAVDYVFSLDNFNTTFHFNKSDIERKYISISAFGTFSSLNKSTIKEYSIINQYLYDNNKFILGLEHKNIDGLFKSANVSSFGTTADLRDVGYKNKAIFLSNTYHLNDTTLLETNLRYDDFDKFDNKTTYKVGVKHEHKFLKGFTSSANYYSAYDAPSSYQLSDMLTINPLKPSYSKGYDVSLAYKELLRITYFNNKVEDYIGYFSHYNAVTFIYTDWYKNIDGKLKFSGLEISSSYLIPIVEVNFAANYTHLFHYDDDKGKKLQRRAKDMLNVSLTYYTNNHTYMGVDAQYVGDRIEYTYGTYNIKAKTGNYTVWNLNLGTELMKNLDLSLHAKNIFNKKYQSVDGYATQSEALYGKLKYKF